MTAKPNLSEVFPGVDWCIVRSKLYVRTYGGSQLEGGMNIGELDSLTGCIRSCPTACTASTVIHI